MKLLLNELISNRYYCLKSGYTYFYFKYKGCNKYHIFCDGYEITKNHMNKFEYRNALSGDIFCDIGWFNDCDSIIEINLKDIIEYLPNDNLDKKYCIRQGKIESLLSNK